MDSTRSMSSMDTNRIPLTSHHLHDSDPPLPSTDRTMQLMLDDFYGLEDSDEEEQDVFEDSFNSTPQTPQEQTNNTNLDAASFNVDEYISKLFQASSLQQLFLLDQVMSREVRSLDSDLQTLVYDNYQKFIAASETIGNVQTSIEEMNDPFQRLESSVSQLKKKSAALEQKLSADKLQIERLSGVRQLVTNLSFLFNLPKRLEESIESGNYAQAVRDVEISSSYLQRHQSMDSFAHIRQETDAVVVLLKNRLRAMFKETKVLDEQEEYISLLLKLEESPQPLAKSLLASREKLLLEGLHSSLKSSDDSVSIIYRVEQSFISPFTEILETFCRLFVSQRPLLDKFTLYIFQECFHCLSERFQSLSPEPLSGELVELVEAIDSLHLSILSSPLKQLLSSSIQHCIHSTFRKLEQDIQTSLLSSSLSHTPIVNLFLHTLESLRPILLLGDEEQSTLSINLVHECVGKSIDFLVYFVASGQMFEHEISTPRVLVGQQDMNLSRSQILHFSQIATQFAERETERILERTQNLFPSRAGQKSGRRFVQKFNQCVSCLYLFVAESLAEEMANYVLQGKCEEALQSFNQVLGQLSAVFPGCALEKGKEVPRSPGKRGRSVKVEIEIDRLFAQQSPVFQLDSLTLDSLIVVVIRGTLKNMLENIRLSTVDIPTAQRLQRHIFLIQSLMPMDIPSDTRTSLHSLIDELLLSIRDRCPSPSPFLPSSSLM